MTKLAIYAITLLALGVKAGTIEAAQATPPTPAQTARPAAEPKTEQEKAPAEDAKKKAEEATPATPRMPGFTVAVRGGYFTPSEAAFRDVYGGGFAFGMEVTARVWKGFRAWIEGGVFSKTGRLTYTGETTKVRITPFGLGLDYGIELGRWRAYAGAGLSTYDFRETNVIGDVSSGGLGWKARAGVSFRFAKKFFADARLSFSRCDIEPSGIPFDIGGLELGLGLGYLF